MNMSEEYQLNWQC